MKTGHVAVNGNEVRFRFTGKSGKQWSLRVRDRPIAKIIRTCQDLPGQELLQYLDDEGQPRDVTSSDVDPYLKEITGENITAKDFRTWAGTVLAAMALNELKSFDSAAQAKRNLRKSRIVASRLGNTATICREMLHTSRRPHVVSRWQPRPGDQVSSRERTARGLGPSQIRGGRCFGDVASATGARALARCAATFLTQDPSGRPRCLEQTPSRA